MNFIKPTYRKLVKNTHTIWVHYFLKPPCFLYNLSPCFFLSSSTILPHPDWDSSFDTFCKNPYGFLQQIWLDSLPFNEHKMLANLILSMVQNFWKRFSEKSVLRRILKKGCFIFFSRNAVYVLSVCQLRKRTY